MNYRALGRTGIRVSEIGMGCEGMVEKDCETVLSFVNALDRPGVASVLCGARTVAELEADAAFEACTMEERDYASALASFPRISWKGHCMYCGHCAPCPAGISVADVTKFLNLTAAQGFVPETVREHYAVLPHKAGECIGCGVCETRCPFAVPIRENMRRAKAVFSC